MALEPCESSRCREKFLEKIDLEDSFEEPTLSLNQPRRDDWTLKLSLELSPMHELRSYFVFYSFVGGFIQVQSGFPRPTLTGMG